MVESAVFCASPLRREERRKERGKKKRREIDKTDEMCTF